MLSTLKTWLSAIPMLFGYRYQPTSKTYFRPIKPIKPTKSKLPSSFPLFATLINPEEDIHRLYQAALKLEEDKKYGHMAVYSYFRIAEEIYPSSDLLNTKSLSPDVLQANLKLKELYQNGNNLPKSSLYANHYHCKAACLDLSCAETFLKDFEQIPTATKLQDTRRAIPYLQAAIVCLAKPYREQYGLAESIKKAEDYLQQANSKMTAESLDYVNALRDQIVYELARHYEAVAVEHATYEENNIEKENSENEIKVKVNINPWYEKAANYYSQVNQASTNYVDAQYKAANLYAYSLNNETKAIAILTKANPPNSASELPTEPSKETKEIKKISFFMQINEWLNSWTNVRRNLLPANKPRNLQPNHLANPITEFLISTPKGELAMPHSDYLKTGQQAITPEKINEWQQNCQQPSAFYNSVCEIINKAKIKLGDDVPEKRQKEGENSRWARRQAEIKALEQALEEASFDLEILQPNGTTNRIRVYDDTQLCELCSLIVSKTDNSFSFKALFKGWNQLIDDLESLLEKVIYEKVLIHKHRDIILKIKNDFIAEQQKQFAAQMDQMQESLASTKQKLEYEEFNAGVIKLKEEHEELNKKYLEQKYQTKELEKKLALAEKKNQKENEQKHQREMQQQKADHENQIQSLQQEHQQATQQQQSSYENLVTELKQENWQLRQGKEQLKQKVNEQEIIISDLNAVVKLLTMQIAKTNADMQSLNEKMDIMQEERQQDRHTIGQLNQTIEKLIIERQEDRQTIEQHNQTIGKLTVDRQQDRHTIEQHNQTIEKLTIGRQQDRQTIEILTVQTKQDKRISQQKVEEIKTEVRQELSEEFRELLGTKTAKISELEYQLCREKSKSKNQTSDISFEQLQALCVCPITLETIFEPVIAADGHIYEKNAIESWFKTSNHSPMTNLPIDKKLTPIHLMKDLLCSIQTASFQPQAQQFLPSTPALI